MSHLPHLTIKRLVALAVLGAGGCGGDELTVPTQWTGPVDGRPTLPSIYRPTGHAAAGDVFVHLFEWTWPDVATECESVLAPAGWRAAQVSPPQEHGIVNGLPWYQRYQAVSYGLESRSGSEVEFAEMVQRCAAVGVGIYVDAIVNHMAASDGIGSGGSAYTKYDYPGLYGPADFHPPCALNDYNNAANVQDCELLGLADLHTGRAEVRERIAGYLTKLARLGVAGFRIDAAMHIQPVELDSILPLVNRAAAAEGRPAPYVFGEVIDYGGTEAVRAADYFGLGYTSGAGSDLTEFRFRGVAEKFAGAGGQTLAELATFPGAWGVIPGDKAVVFLQNHDTQRDAGSPAVGYDDGDAYRLANVWMLAQPYGHPKVMSGYAFDLAALSGRALGPPSHEDGKTRSVYCPERLEDAGVGGWVCEHRDPMIAAMVDFRREVAGTPLERWWDNGANAIAFSRGDRGFVAMSLEDTTVAVDVATSLSPGAYCDVLTGGSLGGRCAGLTLTVTEAGRIQVELEPHRAVAVHGGTQP